MGMLGTRWEAEHEGHELVVSRNELTKGFKLEWDGTEIARRSWSWIGLGELHATADATRGSYREAHRQVEVQVAITWGGVNALDGECTITVDGHEIPVRHVK
ncbi:MAG: hypothetical protein IPI67_36360 [Myxococcales bacterium]|nr:hypothetical protein [Myxococcales bacterium]